MINPTVSFVRVLSMAIVISTHFLSWKGICSYQINTIAVSAFLFISGYLYGNKKKFIKKNFFLSRIKRVLVPFWILTTFISFYLLINKGFLPALQNFFETFFCLQGIHWIFYIPFELGHYHISGLGHCWFLTIIMVCYILVIGIKNTKIELFADNHITLVLFTLFLLHLVLSFFHIAIGTIIIFFVGYFFSRIETKYINYKSFTIVITFLSLIAFFARVILRQYIDETPVYNYFIASLTSNICALSFYAIIHQICHLKANIANQIILSKQWGGVDKMTYPIYLTHYMFLNEPFEILFVNHNVLQIVVFLIFSISSAFILNGISEILIKNNKSI